jgi:hypothetical protein
MPAFAQGRAAPIGCPSNTLACSRGGRRDPAGAPGRPDFGETAAAAIAPLTSLRRAVVVRFHDRAPGPKPLH